MSRFKRKIKINWKNIISFVLVGALLFGVVAGLSSIFGKDTKTISSMAFAVGSINEQGNYEKSDLSIYTKDMFACQGLSIEPDFEATGAYQVFFYDEDKNFIGATDIMEAEEGVYKKSNDFAYAKYCRIVITPDVPNDEDGNPEEDFKIRFYEVVGYADDYNITVNKKQNSVKAPYKGANKMVYLASHGGGYSNGVNGFDTYPITTGDTYNISDLILTSGCNNICIYAEKDKLNSVDMVTMSASAYIAQTSLSSLAGETVEKDDFVYITIDVPTDCAGFILQAVGSVDFSAFKVYAW